MTSEFIAQFTIPSPLQTQRGKRILKHSGENCSPRTWKSCDRYLVWKATISLHRRIQEVWIFGEGTITKPSNERRVETFFESVARGSGGSG